MVAAAVLVLHRLSNFLWRTRSCLWSSAPLLCRSLWDRRFVGESLAVPARGGIELHHRNRFGGAGDRIGRTAPPGDLLAAQAR
ncbi:hypothetical protein GCM10023339_60940 [Alloalcanivorax gelatiniphagus]